MRLWIDRNTSRRLGGRTQRRKIAAPVLGQKLQGRRAQPGGRHQRNLLRFVHRRGRSIPRLRRRWQFNARPVHRCASVDRGLGVPERRRLNRQHRLCGRAILSAGTLHQECRNHRIGHLQNRCRRGQGNTVRGSQIGGRDLRPGRRRTGDWLRAQWRGGGLRQYRGWRTFGCAPNPVHRLGSTHGCRRGTQTVQSHVWQQRRWRMGLEVGRGIEHQLALPAAHPPVGDAQLICHHLEQGSTGRAAGGLAHGLGIVGPARRGRRIAGGSVARQRRAVIRIQPSSWSATVSASHGA